MRLRFPPSPTGHLHVGNVRTALYNWLLARKNDGTLVVRIEDTDVARSTKENEERLLKDLKWLGLNWDEGPEAGGEFGPYRQSERLDLYKEKIDQLMAGGNAYHCFCTPEELEVDRKKALAEKRAPKYSGKCRSLDPEKSKQRVEAGEAAAIRFKVEAGPAIEWDDLVHGELKFERDIIGDFVFVRSEGMPAYNFAVVVDDALMGMTHVIRGDDHISNTPRQILLYNAMGFDLPRFAHLPMILGSDGSRLSKRHGATSVEQFREAGYLPKALINFLALLGWNPGDEKEIFSEEELIKAFGLERVNKSASIFNVEKLDWLNGQYMRSTPLDEILHHTLPFLEKHGLVEGEPSGEFKQWYIDLVDTFNSGSSLVEIADGCRMAFEYNAEKDLNVDEAKEVLDGEDAQTVIAAFHEELSSLDAKTELDADSFKASVKAVQKKTGIKGKYLFHPVRVVVSGKASGPELAKLVPLLEKGEKMSLPKPVKSVRQRVSEAVEFLGL